MRRHKRNFYPTLLLCLLACAQRSHRRCPRSWMQTRNLCSPKPSGWMKPSLAWVVFFRVPTHAVFRPCRSGRPGREVVREIQEILDPYCFALVEINPEARVKVVRGPAAAELIQNGWKTFLVKVQNQAAVNSVLEAESPNAAPLLASFHRPHRTAKTKM